MRAAAVILLGALALTACHSSCPDGYREVCETKPVTVMDMKGKVSIAFVSACSCFEEPTEVQP